MGGEVPEPRRLSRALSSGYGGVPEEALHLVDETRDREAVSLVCRRWHRIDALTRKHVTIGFCYAAEPARLRARFPRLESLAIKGKPRAAMYGLIPEDFGAYAAPWLTELAAPLECLKVVHLRRMTVTDDDIAVLVRARGHMLQVLKLDKCSGFSMDALHLVARSCSLCGRIIEERRRRLSPDLVEQLLYIKDWELGDARAQHCVENLELEASFADLYLDDD